MSEITIMDVNRNALLFEYDQFSSKINAVVNLQPGVNTFYIKANNNCGSVLEIIYINYSDCALPNSAFISPNQSGLNIENPNYEFSVKLNHLESSSAIQVYLNNNSVGFSLNGSTKI